MSSRCGTRSNYHEIPAAADARLLVLHPAVVGGTRAAPGYVINTHRRNARPATYTTQANLEVPCPGCDSMMRRKDYDAHVKKCPAVKKQRELDARPAFSLADDGVGGGGAWSGGGNRGFGGGGSGGDEEYWGMNETAPRPSTASGGGGGRRGGSARGGGGRGGGGRGPTVAEREAQTKALKIVIDACGRIR